MKTKTLKKKKIEKIYNAFIETATGAERGQVQIYCSNIISKLNLKMMEKIIKKVGFKN